MHSPKKVPGFNEFRPHVALFFDALGNMRMAQSYRLPIMGRSILPLLFVEVRDDKLIWYDKVLPDNFTVALTQAMAPMMEKYRKVSLASEIYDTFAGMAIPPYAYPASTHIGKIVNLVNP